MNMMKTILAGAAALIAAAGCRYAPDGGAEAAMPDCGARSAASSSGDWTTLSNAPCAVPKNVTLLDALALFAGETDADATFNEAERKANSEGPRLCRNSLFLRWRTADGTDGWRLLMTSGGNWKDADGMNGWCKDRARDVRECFMVLKARLSQDGHSIWLVCNPHTCTYNVVCRFDLRENTFRVVGDGDTCEEEPDGTILVQNKKTCIYEKNGDPLGAAWYDEWINPDGTVVRKSEPVNRAEYVLDYDTATLKKEFEREWLKHVAGYTNYTTAGMAEDYADMEKFIKEWKPRILRHQACKEQDSKRRDQMVERMLKYSSIDELYYGLLVSHCEIWDRWDAYDRNKNARGRLDGIDVQFKDGRARWMNRELDGIEMSAMLYDHYFWPACYGKAFALIFTDMSANFDEDGIKSDSLANCWLGLFSNGMLVKAEKLPCGKDVRWMPNLECGAPYGRKYTLAVVFNECKAKVVNCATGEAVLTMDAAAE